MLRRAPSVTVRRRRAWSLALTAVVVLVSGACGTSPRPATSPTTAPATTPAKTLVASTVPWHLPVPVSRAVVCSQGGRLLVLGGLTTGDVSTNDVWSVDPTSGAAQPLPGLSQAVHDAGGVCTGGQGFVFGGGSFGTVATVQSWSPSGSHVVGELPQARSDLAAAQLGDEFLVVAGFDGTAMTPDVLATTDGSHFSVLGDLAVPVRYPAVAEAAGALWVIGGQLGTSESSSVGGQTDAIQRFDPATGQTVVVGHLPTPLGHASAVVLGGQLFVLGGRVGSTPTAQIWLVDTGTGVVRPAGMLPDPQSDAGVAVIGETGWLVGGEVSGPLDPLDSVVELRVGSSSGAGVQSSSAKPWRTRFSLVT